MMKFFKKGFFLVVFSLVFLFAPIAQAQLTIPISGGVQPCSTNGGNGFCYDVQNPSACSTGQSAPSFDCPNPTFENCCITQPTQQQTPTLPGLVPCGTTYTGNTPCTLCHLFVGISNITTYLLKIMVFVGLLVIVIAGVMYIVSAGNEHLIEMAKKALWAVLIGFVIVLSAWIIVTTVLRVLAVGGEMGLTATGWSTFDCKQQ